jgi:phage terminase large subunit-like protein
VFDQQKADRVVEFINLLKHTGDFRGQPFNMLPWQKEIAGNIYGTVNDAGLRQYRYAYIEIPKKNGKSELSAAFALYHLISGTNEEIYCCACDKQQAAIVYKAAKAMIEQDTALNSLKSKNKIKLRDSQKAIYFPQKNNSLQVLSADVPTKHGLNPTLVIFDELHAQPNRDLWDVMTFGAGAARKEPLWIIITTAGDDPDKTSIGWEMHEYATKVESGEIIDPTWYVKIYGATEQDDVFDEEVWKRVNPSLGVSIGFDAVRKEAQAAKNSESSLKLFKWLRLNMWVSIKHESWLPVTLFDACCNKEYDKSKYYKKSCYIGNDLSSTQDLTAKCLLFPPQSGIEKMTIMWHGYIPENNIKEREQSDKVPFAAWVRQEYLTATPGDVVDYDYIKSDIRKDAQIYSVKGYGGDPWNGEKLRQDLLYRNDLSDKEYAKIPEIELIAVPQTKEAMSPIIKEFERMIRNGEVVFLWNPCARWCFGNMKLHTDGNENMKPMKTNRRARIDMIMAMFDAYYIYSKNKTSGSIYEKRGVMAL